MSNKIDFTFVSITDTKINVSSPSTSWFNETLADKIDFKDLLDRYTSTMKFAKDKGVKIIYKYGTKKKIKAVQDSYEQEYLSYAQDFAILKEQVQQKVTKGFYTPTSDDTELNAIYTLRNSIMAYFYGNRPLSAARALKSTIEELESALESDTLYSFTI
jgi:hypothetical protein